MKKILLLVALMLVVAGCKKEKDWSAEPFTVVEKAAEQGDAKAQCELGWCYYNGEGVAQDYAEAAKWYRKAAEQGNAEAQFLLGGCYLFGEGVSQDEVEAVKWLRKAAEQGDDYAIETLEGLTQ